MSTETLEKTINESDVQIIDDKNPSDICLLPNGKIICANRDSSCLTVYDDNLNLYMTIDNIDNQPISPTGVTTDCIQRIYFTDQYSNSVIMTDLDFNLIKKYHSQDNDQNKLERPFGIQFHWNYVYVCDTDNERIQILTAELEFLKLVKFDYRPWKIRISNGIALVADGSLRKSCIYDLDDFKLKNQFEHGFAQLSLLFPYFIEVTSKQMLYFYDLDGNLVKEFKLDKISEYVSSTGWDGCMVIRNNFLIITSDSQAKLLKLQILN